MALQTGLTGGETGHLSDHNTLHAAYNNVEAVPNTVWIDGTNGSDSNSGRSALLPKQTITAGLAALSAGWQLNIAPGTYTTSTGWSTNLEGLRIVGAGGMQRFNNYGVTLQATGTGGIELFRFNSTTSLKHGGPEFVNINFDDNTTGSDCTLLRIHNTNRWRISRCQFKGASGTGGIGLHTTKETTGDNAWGIIDGFCLFYDLETGVYFESGYGHKDFSSEFTNCNLYSVVIGTGTAGTAGDADSHKFFGTFFDGGDNEDWGRIKVFDNADAQEFYGCKFERLGGLDSGSNPQYMVELDSSDNKLIGCSFSSGTDQQDAGVYLGPNSSNNTIAFPSYTFIGQAKRVLRHASAGAAMVIGLESDERLTANYTVTNGTTDRTFDANTTDLQVTNDVLATLIEDLTDMGIIT